MKIRFEINSRPNEVFIGTLITLFDNLAYIVVDGYTSGNSFELSDIRIKELCIPITGARN